MSDGIKFYHLPWCEAMKDISGKSACSCDSSATEEEFHKMKAAIAVWLGEEASWREREGEMTALLAERDKEIASLRANLRAAQDDILARHEKKIKCNDELQQLRAQVAALQVVMRTIHLHAMDIDDMLVFDLTADAPQEPLRVVQYIMRLLLDVYGDDDDPGELEAMATWHQAVALFGRPEKEVGG